jgi:hypothetical protein
VVAYLIVDLIASLIFGGLEDLDFFPGILNAIMPMNLLSFSFHFLWFWSVFELARAAFLDLDRFFDFDLDLLFLSFFVDFCPFLAFLRFFRLFEPPDFTSFKFNFTVLLEVLRLDLVTFLTSL